MSEDTLAIDIGGTKIAAGLVRDGQVVATEICPTPSQEGREAILDAAAKLALSVKRSSGSKSDLLGVASAGVIDQRGRVIYATDSLKDWLGTDINSGLAAKTGLQTVSLNDVHAHAWGEYLFGGGRGYQNLILLAVGTGLGAGLILDGSLLRGANGVAGHLGHIDIAGLPPQPCSCGKSGHAEAVSSGAGMQRCFYRSTGVNLSGSQIAAAASHADNEYHQQAKATVRNAGYALGRAIACMLNVVNPELVILTGSVTRAGRVLGESVQEGLKASAIDLVAETPVVLGELENAALVGAAAWARRETNER